MILNMVTKGSGGGGAFYIVDTPDGNGGTIREIVAVDISQDTVTAAHLESGYTAHDKDGNPISGSLVPGITPSGTLSITSNGTHNVTNYASADVSVTPTLQTKTGITPTESSQTVGYDAGYDGLNSVQIDPISSTYVGSGITQRDSTDLSASGATVTAPSGYYGSNATYTVPSGSASTPATSITANPSISVSSGGLITATASASQNVTPSVSAGYVSSGTAGTVSVSGSNTQQLSTQAAATITPTTSQQTAVAAGKYTTGAVLVDPIPPQYIVPSGNFAITANGTGIDVSQYATVSVAVSGGKNCQGNFTINDISSTSYVATGLKLTVDKDGTYDVHWVGWRNTSSGTSGTRLHVNGTAQSTAITTFTGTYGQQCGVGNLTLHEDDVVEVYARSRNTSYRMYVTALVIMEQ